MRVLYKSRGGHRIPPEVGTEVCELPAENHSSCCKRQEPLISAFKAEFLCFWALLLTFHHGGQFSLPVDHLQKVKVSC